MGMELRVACWCNQTTGMRHAALIWALRQTEASMSKRSVFSNGSFLNGPLRAGLVMLDGRVVFLGWRKVSCERISDETCHVKISQCQAKNLRSNLCCTCLYACKSERHMEVERFANSLDQPARAAFACLSAPCSRRRTTACSR